MKANIRRSNLYAAYAVAVCADLLQICLFPIFSEGAASPFDDFLDGAVCITLTLLVGWHIAFLPSFMVKLIPLGDFAPTWTIALLIATRHRRAPVVIDVPNMENQNPEMKSIGDAGPKPPIIPPEN